LSEKITIVKLTIVMFAVTGAAKAVQIMLYPLMAAYFGVSGDLESFFIAFSIPTLILGTLLGSFGMVYIPFFTEERLKCGEQAAWDFASSLMNVILCSSIIVTVLSVIGSPWLIFKIAPGMNTHYKELAITLARFMSGSILLFTVTVIFTAVLNACQSFILPAIIALLANIMILIMILIAGPKINVFVLVAAYMISAACAAALLLFSSKYLWMHRYRCILKYNDPAINRALRMFTAAGLIGIANQIILIANRYFASFLVAGSIATLEYASRANIFTVELLASSIVIPLYQRISVEAANDDRSGLAATFTLGIKIVAVVLLPIAIFMSIFRVPIFSLLLEHGKFTAQNNAEVSTAFLFLSLSMIANGFAQVIVSIFYALKKTFLLLFLSVTGVIINILLDAVLYKLMLVNGLALATSITAFMGAAAGMLLLRKEMKSLDVFHVIRFIIKIFFLAFLSCGLSWITFCFMDNGRIDFLIVFGKLIISAMICLTSYIFLMNYFKVEEINYIVSSLKDRLVSSTKAA